MPVILPREAWSAWLSEMAASADELQALLNPFPAERMRAYPVSTKVNSVKTSRRCATLSRRHEDARRHAGYHHRPQRRAR
jgi:putative SOS response-associated peptidase YedK